MTRTIHSAPLPAAVSDRVQKQQITRVRDPYDALRFWSAFTHGLGAVLSVLSGAALIVLAAYHGAGALDLVSLAVYTASMTALYLASCLYHCVNTSIRGRLFLRKLDHSMIYVLIAGTYTPVCLSVLGGALGWSLFGVIWGLAVVGVIVTLCWLDAPRILTTMFYVGMGYSSTCLTAFGSGAQRIGVFLDDRRGCGLYSGRCDVCTEMAAETSCTVRLP